MINFVTQHIVNNLTNQNEINEPDKDRIYYSTYVLLSLTIKLSVTLIPFIILNDIWSFILILLVVSVLRSNVGGFHMNTFMGCTVVTFSFFFITYFISINITFNYIAVIIAHVYSLLVIQLFGPQVSQKRPKYTSAEKKIFKVKGIQYVLLSFLVFLCVDVFPNIIVCTIITLSTQVLMKGLHNEIKLQTE